MLPPRLQPFICSIVISTLLLISGAVSANDSIELPNIGREDLTSLQEEKRIGAAWLKLFRRQVPTSSDPIITDHTEQLLNRLLVHSDVKHKTLSLVIAKNPTLNAFAVPGGVIGIHTGLLNFAETEEQFASVLAHELAHLSQRHYARGVEKQKKQSMTTGAALLASIILAATSGGDAGAAALSATQAYSIDQQLRFSRSFEREADRIGLDILVRAGMNPHAITEMFTQMNKASRFSTKPPEFLLTHPRTNNRIIDATNLARKYPEQTPKENINYQFVRTRAIWLTEGTPQEAIVRFKNELSGFSGSPEASRYGLTLALISDQQFDEAERHITALLKKYPDNLILKIAESDILAGKGDINLAIKNISQLQKEHPNYYPLLSQLSLLHISQGRYGEAVKILIELTELRKEDPLFWLQLAEIAGLDQQLSLLNKARTEYFILHADFDNAKQQLESLKKREQPGTSFYQYAETRLSELKKLKKLAKL